jgi:KDO2-lipid IV(A) lauroyltransferase
MLTPRMAVFIGGSLGWCFGGLPGREQRRSREHLRRAWPQQDSRWIERTARKAFRHLGRMLLWTLANAHRTPREQCRGIVIKGRDNFIGIVRHSQSGKGSVAFTGHIGNWELLAKLCSEFLPISIIGRRLRDPDLDALIVELRQGSDSEVIYQDAGVRPALRALRSGRVLATLPDQDVPKLPSVHVPWFGIPAATPTGPAQLALLTKLPLWSATCHWQQQHWVMTCAPLMHWPQSGDREADTTALTAWMTSTLEAQVRKHPEQWAWWHKRWRRPPPE